MTSFSQAVMEQTTTTANGMAAFKSTLNANVDLFFQIGAMRGENPIAAFTAAYVENPDIALRIVQWVRDIRGGAGERQIFKDILLHLENTDTTATKQLASKIHEIGRFDELLIFKNPEMKQFAYSLYQAAILSGNNLAAKWAPRKGKIAEEFRAFLGFSPKRYRKTLVTLTNVVESAMCRKEFTTIEFSKVPSVAASRYKKAFGRNAPVEYAAYAEALSKGETTINAGAVYPYDVLKGATTSFGRRSMSITERQVMLAQWDALENFVGDASILPMVDVSGSMGCSAGKNSSVSCMDVAVSLGLYLAEKNTGPFRDTFLTFTDTPELMHLTGNVLEKMDQMTGAVGYSTNIQAAFKKVLTVAVEAKVEAENMPKYILILSDMEFNIVESNPNANAMDMIRDSYKLAGYEAPRIVFWNLSSNGHAPARFNEVDVALVSGFSPSILKAILTTQNFDPINIMMQAVMIPRYDIV